MRAIIGGVVGALVVVMIIIAVTIITICTLYVKGMLYYLQSGHMPVYS